MQAVSEHIESVNLGLHVLRNETAKMLAVIFNGNPSFLFRLIHRRQHFARTCVHLLRPNPSIQHFRIALLNPESQIPYPTPPHTSIRILWRHLVAAIAEQSQFVCDFLGAPRCMSDLNLWHSQGSAGGSGFWSDMQRGAPKKTPSCERLHEMHHQHRRLL